jgi:hypothetical protein
MSTLLHLQQSGAIARFEPETDVEERFVYALPRFEKWVAETLPELASNWDLENVPLEQFDDLMAQFCRGNPLAFGDDFKCLYEHEDGVWELKAADLRIFGWFYKRDVFIAACADSAWKIKEYHLYAGYREQTKRDRDQLDLDPPKFIAGSDPNAVVSSFHYP